MASGRIPSILVRLDKCSRIVTPALRRARPSPKLVLGPPGSRLLATAAGTEKSGQARTEEKKRDSEGGSKNEGSSGGGDRTSFFNSTGWETAMGASAGVLLLGVAAMAYQSWYKSHVLRKMENAFNGGYDPVLALAQSGDSQAHVFQLDPPRPEEAMIQRIIDGKEAGHYFLVLGSKGSGKTTMIIDAMSKREAEGCAFFEAHNDPSIVVDRFSESINYNMNRDYLGNLLGLSDLSGMSVYQSVERALHKLEKALIRYSERTGRPAIIVMNSAHLLPRDDDGKKLLHLFQQRAEKWASAGTATFVFTSNDYWVFDVLRKNSNRMDTLTFKDLSRSQSLEVLRQCRSHYYGKEQAQREERAGLFADVYAIAGGRMALLNSISRRKDLAEAADQLVEDDIQWLLSKTGIIEDHDDDVMDEQKWSTCSWLLFSELAKRHADLEADLLPSAAHIHNKEEGEADVAGPENMTDPTQDKEEDVRGCDVPNPHLTWGEARQVMTRPDYIMELDHLNIIHIDRHHHIRADSMPLLRAFRKVSEVPGYAEKLESVMDRVSAIESLGRTRELVWKEQGDGGQFLLRHDAKGRQVESWTLLGGDERLGREPEGAEDDEG